VNESIHVSFIWRILIEDVCLGQTVDFCVSDMLTTNHKLYYNPTYNLCHPQHTRRSVGFQQTCLGIVTVCDLHMNLFSCSNLFATSGDKDYEVGNQNRQCSNVSKRLLTRWA